MKRGWACLMVLAVLSACNNTAEIQQKADSLGKEVDSFGQKVWDSGKQKMKNLKEDIKDVINKKDSTGN